MRRSRVSGLFRRIAERKTETSAIFGSFVTPLEIMWQLDSPPSPRRRRPPPPHLRLVD
ncbi:hypothetical protein [Compostimonas suwonensis]|uniref:hypothetical protein n=1 Tax=Compostimonas suwonensis TaxID=1048394 RepID=UPI0012FD9E47|nr:hypothetical protein [Compostimonas suwonensis]